MRIRELLEKRGRKPPTICHPDRRVSDVLETMRDEGLTAIPVVDKGELVAVLALGELIAVQEDEKIRDTPPVAAHVPIGGQPPAQVGAAELLDHIVIIEEPIARSDGFKN